MEHAHSHVDATDMNMEPEDMRIDCTGAVLNRSFGTWKGHVIPGVVLIVWGSWWAYNVCLRYLASRRSSGAPYRSSAWYPLASRFARLAEPLLKMMLPVLAVSIELYFDHPDGYRYLFCPAGTKYAGRFAVTHLNNWQHTASYPAFFMSGLIDLLGSYIHMPPGLSQAFLAVAFSAEAFLMGTHKKHIPLDASVHWLLYLTMMLCVASILLEMRQPRSVLLGAARSSALVFQGAWLVETAVVMMEDRPQWSLDYMGSTMMSPVVFTMIGVFVCFCYLALYIVLYILQEKGLLWEPAYTPLETQDMEHGSHERFDEDSARDSNDGSPLVGKRSRHVSPFDIDRRYAHHQV